MAMSTMSFLVLLVLQSYVSYCAGESHTFGKYFWVRNSQGYVAPLNNGDAPPKGVRDYNDNKYDLYKPSHASAGKKSPVIIYIFGSGWRGSPDLWKQRLSTPAVKAYNENGIAFVATGYRMLDRSYWYTDAEGSIKREELIHIDKRGGLTLDVNGKSMADYAPRMCFLEMITKCMFDVVQSLEHLIHNADEFNLDIHRIVFISSSGGAAEANYLSFVYHSWNVEKFTPVGMVLESPQFNNPALCTQNYVWNDFLEHMEDGVTAPQLFVGKDAGYKNGWCGTIIECDASAGPLYNDFCNAEWNTLTHARYCSSEEVFNSTTVAELNRTQTWDESIPEFGTGLPKMWLTGKNMVQHVPRPFHIFAHSDVYRDNFLHHPMYVQQYAEYADRLGINYTVFYQEYKHMRQDLPELKHVKEQEVLSSGMGSFRYVSSTGWRGKYPAMKAITNDPTNGMAQHQPFICDLVGMVSCTPSTHTLLQRKVADLSITSAAPFRFASLDGFMGISTFALLLLVAIFVGRIHSRLSWTASDPQRYSLTGEVSDDF